MFQVSPGRLRTFASNLPSNAADGRMGSSLLHRGGCVPQTMLCKQDIEDDVPCIVCIGNNVLQPGGIDMKKSYTPYFRPFTKALPAP